MRTSAHVVTQTDDYDQYVNDINGRFKKVSTAILRTDVDVEKLYEAYLAGFPDASERQYHTCSCCRAFIKNYGGLVTVAEDGSLVPVVWDSEEAPLLYKKSALNCSSLVRAAKITMPFISEDAVLGTPVTGTYHHFALKNHNIFKRAGTNTAHAAASLRREEFASVMQALSEYSASVVNNAVTLLATDALYRSEAVLGQAKFLQELQEIRAGGQGKITQQKLWSKIAAAPTGFLHPRQSMIATLLDDLSAGMSFDSAAARFKSKMHPLAYQRPQSAPSAGALAAAEKQFEAMGAARSLERRFATLDDLVALWKPEPSADKEKASGIFSHLMPKNSAPAQVVGSPVTITFEKFRRTVMNDASKIEVHAPSHGNYTAYTTAQHADSLPVLQWDNEDVRNPVAWYLYNGGSSASNWAVEPGWNDVTAISLNPPHWYDEQAFSHQPAGVTFMIAGAVDKRKGQGNAMFPSCMKSEFHGMRAVVEAYSQSAELSGREEASACGLRLGKGEGTAVVVRVTTKGQIAQYRIDRID